MKFWINNDNDSLEADHGPSGGQNGDSNPISSIRDLEDYQRLRVVCAGVTDAISRGDARLVLRWASPPSSRLRLGIFEAADRKLGYDFVRLVNAGNSQRSGLFARRVTTTVQEINEAVLPNKLPDGMFPESILALGYYGVGIYVLPPALLFHLIGLDLYGSSPASLGELPNAGAILFLVFPFYWCLAACINRTFLIRMRLPPVTPPN